MSRQCKPVRWTLDSAGSEFGCDSKTLGARMKRAGIGPGKDGKFSTREVCAAVFGDIDSEVLRVKKHQANLLELEEQEKRRESVSVARVEEVWGAVFVALRQAIWNCDAPEVSRRRWLGEIQSINREDYFKTAKPVELEDE